MGADIDFSPITRRFDTVIYDKTTPEEKLRRVKDAEVIVINKVVIDKETIDAAPNLKLVAVFAVGYNNIDVKYCREKGIRVRNVPGYCTDSVAQHTFALLFQLIESLNYYDGYVKDGSYTHSGLANHMGRPFSEIAGKRWGIIGMGNIGRRVAHIAEAFGCKVSYASTSGVRRPENWPEVSMDELLAESDIISIHAPLSASTENLINREALAKMKPSAVIVNVGRGAIIDSAALAEAVDQGLIGGAAIDVYPEEPPKANDSLLTVKNREKIVLSPHIAWSSVEARARCVEMTADNISAFIEGKDSNDVW
ncbi:MAG: hydroxyacid dehydrogenase [Oscillospiraceae bacterium]|nr:hydroxyacid dehydrogenase [Oscillospiraceae bacterium]